jgi:hypothetical protein
MHLTGPASWLACDHFSKDHFLLWLKYRKSGGACPFLFRQAALAALFVISAEYFSRTDFARNWLGIFAIATFIFHLYVLFSFDVAISKFREGLDWIYRTYFTGAEQTNLKLRELRPSVDRVTLGLGLVSFLGCLMTLIYMWSVRAKPRFVVRGGNESDPIARSLSNP